MASNGFSKHAYTNLARQSPTSEQLHAPAPHLTCTKIISLLQFLKFVFYTQNIPTINNHIGQMKLLH